MSSLPRNDTERIDALIDSFQTRRYCARDVLGTLKSEEIRQELLELGVSSPTRSHPDKDYLISVLSERRDESCAICLSSFAHEEAYRRTQCGHCFHDECLRNSAINEFKMHSRPPCCPTCRAQLRGELQKKRNLQTADSADYKRRRPAPGPSGEEGVSVPCRVQ